jgi:hypothetical protein
MVVASNCLEGYDPAAIGCQFRILPYISTRSVQGRAKVTGAGKIRQVRWL